MTSGLADQMRSLPDEELAALVRLRPDLVVPVPADLTALAARAQARGSVARALDPLDRFTLEILDAIRLARVDGVASVDAVLALAAAARPAPDPGAVRDAIERLRAARCTRRRPGRTRRCARPTRSTRPAPGRRWRRSGTPRRCWRRCPRTRRRG